MNNLSVLQKTLILACTPLVFQVIFAAILFNSLEELNEAIQKELRCQAVIAAANSVYQASLEGAVRGTTNVLTKSAPIESIFREHARTAKESISRLKSLTLSDPEQSERSARLSALTERIESACIQENRDLSEDSALLSSLVQLRRYKLLESLVQPLATETRAIVEGETRKLETARVNAKRKTVHSVLFIGLGVDLLICCGLAWFFSAGMVDRLMTLSKNATDFARGQFNQTDLAIETAVSGSDELARLDSSFRKMAQNLTRAKAWRQEYLSMLNHDIRLPLTAALSVVALCQREAYGKLLSGASFRLRSREKELTDLVDLLEDLLDLERMNAGMMPCQSEETFLSDVLRTAVGKVSLTADLNHQTIKYEPSSLVLNIDREKLTRLLVRIISMVLELCPEKAELRVYAEMQEGRPVILIDYPGPSLSIPQSDEVLLADQDDFGWQFLHAVARLINVGIDVYLDREVSRQSVILRLTLFDGCATA